MKRVFPILLVLLMLVSAARAEVVGRSGDDYIHRWTAPNGQELYFVAVEEPFIRMQDVNFDGVEDVVVTTFFGASNVDVAFFVWDGGAYVAVEHPGMDRLINYELYPEAGVVATGSSEGMAGAWHTKQLWRWQGTSLELVRSAESYPVETVRFEDDVLTVITDNSRVRLRVWDVLDQATENGVTAPALLMDVEFPLDDEEAFLRADEAEQRALWQGLLP